MKYYSEDEVKKILLGLARTAHEQRKINNGEIFFNRSSIELPNKHGRLIDADTIRTEYDPHFGGRIIATIQAIDNAPTIVEATDE